MDKDTKKQREAIKMAKEKMLYEAVLSCRADAELVARMERVDGMMVEEAKAEKRPKRKKTPPKGEP